MLHRITLTLSFKLYLAPVFAGSWGGYVSHEGVSEAAACDEARKQLLKYVKNGEFFTFMMIPALAS